MVLSLTLSAVAHEPVYPGKHWVERKPADVGLDAVGLKAFSDYVGGRGCVVRHGYLAHQWGDMAKRADAASACKPWFTHFLLAAVEAGKIASLDEKVVRWEPRLAELNKALGPKDRDITWRHLANQCSCYGVEEGPGSAYDYNDDQIAMFADTLFAKVYGTTWDKIDREVLGPLLTDVLQCQDQPTLLAFGPRDRLGRLGVSVRDFARFGLLYLELLAAAITSGRAHLARPDGKAPQECHRWGWRGKDFEERPTGSRVGWVDGEDVYVELHAAYAVVQKLAADSGETFPLRPPTLAKRLNEAKLLASTDHATPLCSTSRS